MPHWCGSQYGEAAGRRRTKVMSNRHQTARSRSHATATARSFGACVSVIHWHMCTLNISHASRWCVFHCGSRLASLRAGGASGYSKAVPPKRTVLHSDHAGAPAARHCKSVPGSQRVPDRPPVHLPPTAAESNLLRERRAPGPAKPQPQWAPVPPTGSCTQ